MKHSVIPEHRSDKAVKVNIARCTRCGDPMPSRSRKKFCGGCSDINAEERRFAAYEKSKAAKCQTSSA